MSDDAATEIDRVRLLELVEPLTELPQSAVRSMSVELVGDDLIFTVATVRGRRGRRLGADTVCWRRPVCGAPPEVAEELGFPTWEHVLAVEIEMELAEGFDAGDFVFLERDRDGTVWVGEEQVSPDHASRWGASAVWAKWVTPSRR